MKKIKNPFNKIPDYNCFGCSPNNQLGLKMEFFEDGEEIVSFWEPVKHFNGYVNVLHGGIQSSLIDEIAYWTVLIKLKTSGVTARLDVRLKKPLYMDKGKIMLRSKLVEVKGRIAMIAVKIFNFEKELCAIANVYYYTYPLDESINNLCYPANYSEFFES
ncbi:MAG: PaaI family thioesterase [Bacteroidetes bacterium]|nr:PaaI family thioesterase [Bacteroidota bacterium]